ncbi:TIGR01777 family oxidoreductase [Phytoactinopolyspora halotolerans]|uniref:TIGR01777 family protein n=1 Tax=Phytoactinopolyspora halotolerans TaxID=1981512 RepID=A0A6L9SB72_9ACTN|nr:TIGR01777 family oxidoreductase [Phytoactinopolyspora halotolerans]NEE01758.1 TIGR01777 family protein [Phytoactinopolyspora halotolerans]
MRVAISGSSGFIGTALVRSLTADGHNVLRLVRRPAVADAGEVPWDPAVGDIDPAPLEGLDAVVNLCGAHVGERRWTKRFKEELYRSRIRSTSILANALTHLDRPPRVFVSATGTSAYGRNRGADVLDEDSGPGAGFLADLCQAWEAAAEPAKSAGVAVCYPRFGLVADSSGGMLARMLPLFRSGLGGPLAGGGQYWSHVSLPDTVRALRFLIEQPGCVGAFNITAPEPATNAEFTRVLAHALNRPAIMPVPRFALRIALGESAEYLAGSLRVLPRRLVDSGFVFEHHTARDVVTAALHGRPSATR